jgi:hypothetical protein
LQDSKKEFSELMPFMRGLTADEQEAFLHKIRNSNRVLGDSVTGDLFDEMTF